MMLGEVPLLSLFDRPISGLNHAVKWFEDKFIALFVLGLIWPLLVLVAIAIKLDSPGHVFFRQPREGYNNRSFHVLKFSSMRTDEQQDGGNVQARRNDPRRSEERSVGTRGVSTWRSRWEPNQKKTNKKK